MLNALEVTRAHLVGCSNGGQICLDLALEQPQRVASLTLVGSTPSGFETQGTPPRYLLEMFEAVQRGDVERYLDACREAPMPRLAARLPEIAAADAEEVGGKAAALGELRSRAGLPVPDGFVLTTEAYRQFCGVPLWRTIRDALRGIDLNDTAALRAVAGRLQRMVLESAVPPALATILTERAARLDSGSSGLAVRSSAVGEGGEHTCAGQFLTLLNVAGSGIVNAYKRVLAARFSEQALFYRLSTGIVEVDSPMAVLVLPMIRARASGILYTRDPGNPRSRTLWITATRGLGLDVASGSTPADLFVVSRTRPHTVLETSLAEKKEQLVMQAGGGLTRLAVAGAEAAGASLTAADIETLADYGMRAEEHFRAPQDIEWAIDDQGVWILQSRTLALVSPVRTGKSRAKTEAVLSGGRTVFPGRVSGPAYLAENLAQIVAAPPGTIVFIHRPSPEIVQIFHASAGWWRSGAT
jgi:pyruvate,water dikinase